MKQVGISQRRFATASIRLTPRTGARRLALAALTAAVIPVFISAAARAEPPRPGIAIDRSNLDLYADYMPMALKFAIAHGLIARIVPSTRINWPEGFQQATEKYSGQASLDDNNLIQNYVAGMPFPLIQSSDPKAGVKIAYNWRWGPFVPDDVSIESRPRFMAWKTNSATATLNPDDDDRDFRDEEPCDHLKFLRFSHRTKVDPRPNIDASADTEWKVHGDHCGGTRDVSARWSLRINPLSVNNGFSDAGSELGGLRHLLWTINWLALFPGMPSRMCTYGCTMLWWDYIGPFAEIYNRRLVGERRILACLNALGDPAGITRVGNDARFNEQPFEVRDAYVLELKPTKEHYSILLGLIHFDFLSATVYIDAETFQLLGAEFRRFDQIDSSIPLWSRQSVPDQGTVMRISNEFFVPGDKPEFFLSLNLWPSVQKINSGHIDKTIFDH